MDVGDPLHAVIKNTFPVGNIITATEAMTLLTELSHLTAKKSILQFLVH